MPWSKMTTVAALSLLLWTLVARTVSAQVQCLPGNVIPPGESSCVDQNGRVWVPPPPARQPGGVVVQPPPDMRRRTPEPEPASANPSAASQSPTSAAVIPKDDSANSGWWTVAGITAIAGLIGAFAALIGALRGR
jgi:hypothetical protein